ncbi:hypothetical protein AX15_000677 [Amanita polypyramis BW_CC]|nr:hypothetical protein AX15_000677 [Amanita polypyramis BW_CC]
MDDNNQLFVWDIAGYGQPQLLATARYDQTNFVLTSPSHSHVGDFVTLFGRKFKLMVQTFLLMHTGEVKTYDLLCLRKSRYTLPNLWDLYKRKVASTSKGHEQSLRTSVEVVAYPRDLNLLFVAYAGGVILSDLTQRNIIRAYEYTIPPGAPGGAGLTSPDALTLRQPSVTCMAVHPTGHFFAVGYTDGSVAFWAVEDEDQPLLVKTLDTDDVNIVNAQKLDQLLSSPGLTNESSREPVFKLSWSGFPNSSDPRGGRTILTVLGGPNANEPPGLTVFELPAFNPTDPLTATPSDIPNLLHPHFRKAMRESLFPLKTYFYSTQDIVQDYLLIPRDNPHYAGTFDPVAIIVMTGPDTTTRSLTAFEFPPPAFKEDESHTTERPAGTVDPDELASELEATLQSLMESSEPQRLGMPFPLCTGAADLINARLLTVDRKFYEVLIADRDRRARRLNLAGGDAWADASKEHDSTFAKFQPHRIMVTYNQDGTVQFFDISAQLLSVQIAENLRPMALEHEFPTPLPALTVDVHTVYGDPQVTSLLRSDTEKVPRITLTEFSPQCACVVAVETGELIVFRMRNSPFVDSYHSKEPLDAELISLAHIEAPGGKQLEPYLMISQRAGRVEASSITNIGLLAVSYSDESFVVIDIKASKIILRKSQQKRKSRHTINFHLTSDSTVDPVVELVWAVCSIEKDPQARLRLLAIHLSGRTDLISFMQGTDTSAWSVFGETISAEAIPNPLQYGSFVLDEKTGSTLDADRERLFLTQYNTNSDIRPIFVTTGSKGARAYAGVNGQRIAKIDWSNGKTGHVQTAQIVEKTGSYALVAFTDKHFALVYSLPYLDHLHTLDLPPIPSLPPSIDRSGDFIALSPHPISGKIHEAVYGTLFDFRRAYSLPDVELIPPQPSIPSQPQPVSVGPSSLLSAWFRFGLSMSGEQLDTLLGGPERPIPEPEPRKFDRPGEKESSVFKLASRATTVHNELYGRLTSTLSERGQILEDLGERFNSLEEGSRKMVAQAKKLAAQQSAKSWLGF